MQEIIMVGFIIVSSIILVGGDSSTKLWGGIKNVDLPKGKKLVNITWKDSDLWYLTRDMTETDKDETYEFVKESNFGIAEGKLMIKEYK